MDKIQKIVIICGYRCNNSCVFCINAEKKQIRNKTTEEIIAEIAEAKNRGKTYLELIGGELTIRPDIARLISSAKKSGFEFITMATNGRMFAYPDFARKIIKAGLTDLIFSIHGHNAKLHDALTQAPGSFKELTRGLRNVKKLGFKSIASNTTIVKQNYRYLAEIGKFLLANGIGNSEFIFADPTYGGVYDNFKKLMPRISEAAPYIKKCLSLGKGNKKVGHWHVRYVPVCYFQDYLDQISEIHEKKTFHTEHLAPDFHNTDVEVSRQLISRVKPKQCLKCKLNNNCEGLWKEYIRHYGHSELKPVR